MTDRVVASERVQAYYASAAREEPEAFASSLLRTRSEQGRQVLGNVAGAGAERTDLERTAHEYLLTGGSSVELRSFARNLDPAAAAEYAFVLGVQPLTERDEEVARGLLHAICDAHGIQAISPFHSRAFLQLALKARDFETVESLLALAPVRRRARDLSAVDLMNPRLRTGQDEQEWLRELNARFYGGRLVQVGLRPEGPSPFDRLTGSARESVEHPSKITVIMSCFDPGPQIITAARSVVEQTWQNLELLVVDDASPAPASSLLEQLEQLDPRIRVIRKAVNGGTYRARNTALRVSTGEFFTVVDSDDWVHPQFLEVGVHPLLRDETLVATRGYGMRVTPDLELNRVGYRGQQTAAQSLLVRVFPALNRIGFFDSVRKAADTEYARRLEVAFGGSIVNLPRRPLTLLRADESSLSASDFSRGWRHPARQEYAEGQQHFHEEISTGSRVAFVSLHGPRRFPTPRRWERYPEDGTEGAPLDVCVVADWREGCMKARPMESLERAVTSGLRAGIIHLESLHEMRLTRDPVAPHVRDLIARGAVEVVFLDDRRSIRHIVVADPRPLQFAREGDVLLNVAEVNVLPDQVAAEAGHYCAATVEGNLTTMFGIKPAWGAPALPAPVTMKRASLPTRTLITVLADGSCTAEDATVLAWPMREPADGERGARLTAVGALETELEVDAIGALMDAWPLGPAEWARAAARWLLARPALWCLVVRSGSAVHVVSNDGVDVGVTDTPTGAAGSFVLRRGDVGLQLTSSGIGGVERSRIDIDDRP